MLSPPVLLVGGETESMPKLLADMAARLEDVQPWSLLPPRNWATAERLKDVAQSGRDKRVDRAGLSGARNRALCAGVLRKGGLPTAPC